VTAVLRVMGLSHECQFQAYHRILNRVNWSGLRTSQILLGVLVTTFVAAGVPIVLAADETLERRTGPTIPGLGCFRDPVRSTKKRRVLSFGLRWISLMQLVPVPWSSRVWALPFLTVLAPGTQPHGRRRRHKTSIDWVVQLIAVVRRWQGERALVLVVDGALAAVKLGLRCQRAIQLYDAILARCGIATPSLIGEGRQALAADAGAITLFEGVPSTLRQLQRRGFKLGVITNTRATTTEKLAWFRAQGFELLWDAFISSSEVGVRKPDPAIYHIALQQADVAAADVVFVGHAAAELRGARAVGMRTVAFKPDHDAVADLVVPSFAALLALPFLASPSPMPAAHSASTSR